MARRKDAEEDRPSRIVLDQLNTKTVGAPPSSTGLTGDQLPDTIFSADDFDLVKNQVTLQLQNLELLNVLNTIGQITNMQSQSGPIPDTGKIVVVDETTGGQKTIFQPDPGEVWLVTGVSTGTQFNSSSAVLLLSDGTNTVEIGQESNANVVFDPTFAGDLYIDNNVYLVVSLNSTTGQTIVNASFLRVR
jgi:hypothetical protein